MLRLLRLLHNDNNVRIEVTAYLSHRLLKMWNTVAIEHSIFQTQLERSQNKSDGPENTHIASL